MPRRVRPGSIALPESNRRSSRSNSRAGAYSFVVCAPGFTDPNLVSSGLSDLFAQVFGEEGGIGCRATIGVMSLANNHCFET